MRKANRWWNTAHSSHDTPELSPPFELNKNLIYIYTQRQCSRRQSMLYPRFTQPSVFANLFCCPGWCNTWALHYHILKLLALEHCLTGGFAWQRCGRKFQSRTEKRSLWTPERKREMFDPATKSAQQVNVSHWAWEECIYLQIKI